MSGSTPATPAISIKAAAASFALAGFLIAILAGLAAGNPAAGVITQAIAALLVCFIIGTIAGMIFDRVVREHLHAQHPITLPPTVESIPATTVAKEK